ncbi:fumarylacetoacetate hydrolase family protein [Kitasatospora paracochleata]|uniref:2-keto-4-pentenoate hydratase/2-oxohepta-3-ene-1,7-dioic acid hydratase in catechol pathway n=1 Tax=Kitasatospora paracochleata TaxID=58354 RepID=A0ABT1J9H9_9ACTN|nr:fumarylacetoacetate hydrolase family protein [Kitasatospora paracochleata]MCP2313723.1 2-keto-4-pentenoate hydratase/2-oxohepta-3-ene-1,7-dioic acid hydratase in catechol pathway [Kitasatospora paracochleata]
MRLASITLDGRRRAAALLDDGATLALLPAALGTVDDLVRGGPAALDAARAALPGAETVPLADVRLEAPLGRFNRDILCTGWNYQDHFEESRGKRGGQDPAALPTRPTFFTKGPDTVIGPTDDIAHDTALSTQWDYEAEIALVIGRDGRSIPEAEAHHHVFGYLIANDVSQRDLQRAHGGQWLKGKSIDATMPLGPWLTTADEVPDPGDLRVQCEVNGVLLQNASSAQMAFPIARLIAELSQGMTLRAGDVLLTGTPSGIGSAREPQIFLQDGDLVVTRVSGLGELRNRVVATSLL